MADEIMLFLFFLQEMKSEVYLQPTARLSETSH